MAAAAPALKPERARPRANILRHSFVAQDLITRAAEAPGFDELLDRLWDEIQPQGALEIAAFNDLLRARWNIQRLENSARSAPHAFWQRAFHRALSELRRLQSDATLRMKLDAEPGGHLPPLASGATVILQPAGLRRLAYEAALRENRIDFVTSLEDCSFDQLPNEAKRFINRGLCRPHGRRRPV